MLQLASVLLGLCSEVETMTNFEYMLLVIHKIKIHTLHEISNLIIIRQKLFSKSKNGHIFDYYYSLRNYTFLNLLARKLQN